MPRLAKSAVIDWFNLLNQGILPSGTADSDTHQRRTTELNARNYVASTVTDPGLLGGQATTLAANIVAGRSIGTNALFVTVNANAPSTGQTAGLGIGQSTILSTSDGAVNVTVDVKSPLWAEFDKIQFFVNAAPQAYDHDNKPTTRNRYRALPSNVCSPASGCYEKVAGTDFTISTVNDFPSIPGAQHFEASATLNLTGLTGDAWVVVLVRGTDGVSHPLFPVMPNSLKQAGNTTFAQLTDGNLNEEGLLALAFTNPLFIDGNNDTTWTPPGVVLTP